MQLPDLAPGGRNSRIVALGLLGLLLIMLWTGIVQPAIVLIKGDGTLVQTVHRLQDQRRVAERKPALAAEKAALVTAPADLTDFLPGANPSLAAADLQSRLGAVIKGLGGNLTSAEALIFPDEENFHRAGLRLKILLRQEALPPLLHAIEGGKPRLFLSALSVKSSKDGTLALSLDLFGYLKADAS